jgi:hypothetical protein
MAQCDPALPWDAHLGTPVVTADHHKLGIVVDADHDDLVVECGFFDPHDYRVPMADVARCAHGTLFLRVTRQQVLAQNAAR